MASTNHNSHTSPWSMSPNGTPNTPPTSPTAYTSVADQLMQDPAAAALQRQAQPLMDRLAALPEQAANVLLDMHAQIAAVDLRAELSAEGKRTAETAARRTALEAIDKLQQQALATVRQLEAMINAATESAPASDSQAQLLAEMQLQRAWRRIQQRLDNVDLGDLSAVLRIVHGFVADAVEIDDRSVIEALRQELPNYMQAAGKGGFVGAVTQRIDQGEMPFLPAKARAARIIERQLDSGWPRLADCFRMANANASTGDGNVILPGFAANETLNFGSRVSW